MFGRFFSAGREKREAYGLYRVLVTQARKPEFYTKFGVRDTLDGRFDMVLLHMFLVLNRLEVDGAATKRLRRYIQEAMVSDMDRAFRDLGVSDMALGREMKKAGSAWFGRMNAYSNAVSGDAPNDTFLAVLRRNVYRDEPADGAEKLCEYCLSSIKALAAQSADDIKSGEINFAEIPTG